MARATDGGKSVTVKEDLDFVEDALKNADTSGRIA
jgi:hypothetical protein